MTIARKLLEKLDEIELGLEISETVRYNEDNNDPNQMFVSLPNTEEIHLPDADEKERALRVLYTDLIHAPQFIKNKVYIRKEIQTTEYDNAYMYTFKKIKKDEYIIVNKKALKNEQYR